MPNTVKNRPCGGCPYRKDCPSGVWHESEYFKLERYDAETFAQPMGVFLCHDDDRENTICRGWFDTHDRDNLLALRLAFSRGHLDPSVLDMSKSDVPVFDSGAEAMINGLMNVEDPSPEAQRLIVKLLNKHPELDTNG